MSATDVRHSYRSDEGCVALCSLSYPAVRGPSSTPEDQRAALGHRQGDVGDLGAGSGDS